MGKGMKETDAGMGYPAAGFPPFFSAANWYLHTNAYLHTNGNCLFTHEWELPIYTRMESDRGKPQAQSRIAYKTDPLTRMAQQHHHESLPIGIFSPVASAEFRREQSSMELSYSTHE